MQNQALSPEAYSLNFNALDNVAIYRNPREELRAVRDENFNLKLRIYLMEERHASPFTNNISRECLLQKLGEANKLIGELQNSIDEKLDILKNVHIAIEDHKKMHKAYVIESCAKIAQLENCIHNLESKLKENIFNRHAVPENSALMPDTDTLDTPIEFVDRALVAAPLKSPSSEEI